MLRRHPSVVASVRTVLPLILGVTLVGVGSAPAQLPTPSSGTTSGMSREELARSWDLDGDGTISKAEADVARTRMKRERSELQFGGGIDPVTGLPRSPEDEGMDDHTPGDEPEFRLPPEEPPLPPSRGPGAGLPGSRSPSLAPPMIRAPIPSTGLGSIPSPSVPRMDPSQPSSAVPGSPTRSSGASWLSPNYRGSVMTGGVRAGAPPAATGYGSGPWSSLNAARNRYAPAPVNLPRTGAGSLGMSGLGVSPGRTGSILLPGGLGSQPGLGPSLARPTAPVPSVSQPMAPPPPLVQPPRISAEEIGGY